jgi:hypothetical protein
MQSALADRESNLRNWRERLPAESIVWMDEANAYVDTLLTSFPEQPNQEMVTALFDGALTVDALDERQLRATVPGMVPVACVIAMVQKHRVPLHMRMPAFVAFASRYRQYVI